MEALVRALLILIAAAIPMLLCSACLVTIPADDDTPPSIRITAAGGLVTSADDPPGGDFTCADVAEGPVRVTVVASDGGGLAEVWLHLIEGRVVPGSVVTEPDVSDISWAIEVGDTPLSEGDDELRVTLERPAPGMARSGVTVEFDVTAGERTTAIQSLVTDASGNQSITWPFLLPESGTHPSCAEQ